jgi:hypothetical protein
MAKELAPRKTGVYIRETNHDRKTTHHPRTTSTIMKQTVLKERSHAEKLKEKAAKAEHAPKITSKQSRKALNRLPSVAKSYLSAKKKSQ